MSVALTISRSTGSRGRDQVPISTESIFHTYWLPAANLLALRWVPAFAGGIDIEEQDIPEVLDELRRLRAYVASAPRPDWPAEIAAYVLGRIDLLADRLDGTRGERDITRYIG
jgi:hypothetical protein